MRKFLMLAAASSLALACSGNQPVPVNDDIPPWAQRGSGPCLEMPQFGVSSKNLCGVGIAENITSKSLGMETASTRARAEIGAVLKFKVSKFNQAVQDSLSKGGKTDEIQKVQAGSEGLVDTTLTGVSIPIQYHDKKANIYYACAMVDFATLKSAVDQLKAAEGLSDAVKEEVNCRADDILNNWDEARKRAAGN